jgi:hypothetical protein
VRSGADGAVHPGGVGGGDMNRVLYALTITAVLFAESAVAHAQYVIDSLDGEVTQHEVNAFISGIAATSIPTAEWSATDTHNHLADGTGGTTLEGLNDLVTITSDIASLSAEHLQLLDLAIKWTDAWLVHRNDLPLGEKRVMWTGKIEPVWPPNCPTCASPTYYESEVADTVGHMAYTAQNILKTPAIWNDTIPDGDPNHFGATYLARATTYVSLLEFTMSHSFTPYFIDPNTLLIRRPSTAQGYLSSFHNVNAWNVQMMLSNAYWRLAQCHFILGDNGSLATMYQTIVKNTADMFVRNAVPKTAPDGTAVFDWGYGNFGDVTGKLTGEQIGVHGSYDIWGLTRAFSTGYTTVPTAQQMKTYADTVVHEMALQIDPATGAATYAGFNDRCCGTQTYDYLPPGFIFLTPYNTDIYKPAANADITSGRQASSAGLTANVLWAKHWVFIHSLPPDFSFSTGPAAQTLTAGESTSYTASVNPINEFSGMVSLRVSGLPSGASGAFNPTAINGGAGSAALNITTTSSTPAGSYSLIVSGVSGRLSHSVTISLVVNAAVGGLPSGWTDQDIGTDGMSGSASFNSGTFTVGGSGADIWTSADGFNYVSQTITGDITITARVASQEDTSAWAKAGVTIRESIAANAAHVSLYVTPGHGVNMQYRPAKGAASVQLAEIAAVAAPYWVRVQRSAHGFAGFASADGVNWRQVGSIAVTMANSATAGLAVSAHDNAALNTSSFDNVSIAGGAPAQ